MSDELEQDQPPQGRPPVVHYFSANPFGFYASDIHAPEQIPAGAVEISDDLYFDVFQGQAEGHPIIVGQDGMPARGALPVVSQEQKMEGLRVDRDRRLTASDWTMLPDAPLSDVQKAAWVTYRKNLRDLPAYSDPETVAWPAAPGSARKATP